MDVDLPSFALILTIGVIAGGAFRAWSLVPLAVAVSILAACSSPGQTASLACAIRVFSALALLQCAFLLGAGLRSRGVARDWSS